MIMSESAPAALLAGGIVDEGKGETQTARPSIRTCASSGSRNSASTRNTNEDTERTDDTYSTKEDP